MKHNHSKFLLKRVLIILVSLLLCDATNAAEPIPAVNSPDGKLQAKLTIALGGLISFSFKGDGKEILKPSLSGLNGGVQSRIAQRTVKSVWKPLWGKRTTVPEEFNELTLDMKSYQFVVRVYNDGMAFRTIGADPHGELTQFNFAGDYTAWYPNGEHHNLGPEKLSAGEGRRQAPMTIQADAKTYLALHEADIPDGSDPLSLELVKGQNAIKVKSAFSTAWRVILYGRTPGDLIDSHLIELLNPPSPEGSDFSWVKPGIGVWDWRINGAKVEGFDYNMTYPSWVRMVDFAAENHFSYLILDANWYGKEFAKDSNPTAGGYATDARKLITYAKGKNVGIWLYMNDVAGRHYPIEETLKVYHEWGAAGIKYGFMSGNRAAKNSWTQKITRLCAENKLLCDFHDGPVHPFGQLRTWPHAVAREFCHSQLDARRVFEPKTFVTAVFVNMVSGPIDMNNGLADLMQKGRRDNGMPVPSTLAGEIARTLIVFSGVPIIPDIPENYRKHPELLQFLAAEQMPWRESKTVSGVIGEHIVMARQSAEGNWLIGAATNEDGRILDIPLYFLPAGKYAAQIIQDGDDSDYRTHAESYKVDQKLVDRSDKIQVKLAPGGGACILLKLQ